MTCQYNDISGQIRQYTNCLGNNVSPLFSGNGVFRNIYYAMTIIPGILIIIIIITN